ncbi:hypothetical protein BJ912DRAFT_1069065 [Pholiota molesta]|nr:hypothetical protein BJ912DRAFT_1069065 [Pholiota molesta]
MEKPSAMRAGGFKRSLKMISTKIWLISLYIHPSPLPFAAATVAPSPARPPLPHADHHHHHHHHLRVALLWAGSLKQQHPRLFPAVCPSPPWRDVGRPYKRTTCTHGRQHPASASSDVGRLVLNTRTSKTTRAAQGWLDPKRALGTGGATGKAQPLGTRCGPWGAGRRTAGYGTAGAGRYSACRPALAHPPPPCSHRARQRSRSHGQRAYLTASPAASEHDRQGATTSGPPTNEHEGSRPRQRQPVSTPMASKHARRPATRTDGEHEERSASTTDGQRGQTAGGGHDGRPASTSTMGRMARAMEGDG